MGWGVDAVRIVIRRRRCAELGIGRGGPRSGFGEAAVEAGDHVRDGVGEVGGVGSFLGFGRGSGGGGGGGGGLAYVGGGGHCGAAREALLVMF